MARKKVNTEEVFEREVMEEKTEEIKEENSQAPADEEPKETEKPKTGRAANSKFIRLRNAPSANASVVTLLADGDEAEILEQIGQYYKVKVCTTDEIGYIAATHFKED